MIFVYLTAVKEKTGGKRCAVSAHVVPSWTDDFYQMDCYPGGSYTENKMRTLTSILAKLPDKTRHYIRVCTDDHELAWDLTRIAKGESPSFMSSKICAEFVRKVTANDIKLMQFQAQEKGIMTVSERQTLRGAAKADWGFEL